MAWIRGPGRLLVCSDLHGNVEDFRAVVRRFEAEADACLLLLGDLLHGPELEAEVWAEEYRYLGEHYVDASEVLWREFVALRGRYPGRVASLMGNHDHAHIGGPVVSKFFEDEAAHVESKMTAEEVVALREGLRGLPYLGVSSCGVAFTHGAPPERPFTLETLAMVEVSRYRGIPLWGMYDVDWFGELLWRRGSSAEGPGRFLEYLEASIPELPCEVVVHGHEIAREGFAIDHPVTFNLSSSFGMERGRKVVLRLELEGRYRSAAELRVELLPLYG